MQRGGGSQGRLPCGGRGGTALPRGLGMGNAMPLNGKQWKTTAAARKTRVHLLAAAQRRARAAVKAKVGLESAHTGENSGWDGKGDEAPIVGGRHAAACKFQA